MLAPLVDVADYVKRIGDHPDSAHYRADKAGALLRAAVRLEGQALMAYANWPEDGPADRTIAKAQEVLDDVATAVEAVAWSTAKAEMEGVADPSPIAPTWISCDRLPKQRWPGLTRWLGRLATILSRRSRRQAQASGGTRASKKARRRQGSRGERR